jgi:hypothetical protein
MREVSGKLAHLPKTKSAFPMADVGVGLASLDSNLGKA